MGSAADVIQVSVIDVGKGDCILVQAGGAAALIDTGYDDTASDVVRYLRKQGVERLEFMLITHYDKDHIGGIRAIGEAFPIGTIYLPGYEGGDKQYRSAVQAVSRLAAPATRVTQELAITLGGAQVAVLPSHLKYDPHAAGDEGNDNDLSLVATLTLGSDSYLFAGDVEEAGTDALLARGLGAFDVLKVPHHGEKAGNMDELLAAVRPKVAIVTDAADDPADKKTLKQLKKAGSDVYCTSDCGTVVVASDGAGAYRVSHG
ncbi:MAG: MBL fold metallo-hydrolase [Coriobacteriia bacterium]|nr:MBL fold metallo-hydrolase [Coriobacteriia bacterium]